MKDLINTIMLTLGVSKEEAELLAQFVNEDPDPWTDEYEQF